MVEIKRTDVTKEMLEKWIKKQVRAMHKIMYTGYTVSCSDDPEDIISIRNITYVTRTFGRPNIHVDNLKALEFMANVLEETIVRDERWDSEYDRYYFLHNNVELFALTTKRE